MQTSRYNRILSATELQSVAPSIYAERPKDGVSDRYAFIPTTRVLNTLQSEGWQPVFAAQSKARSADGKEYAKHVIRFRKESSINADALQAGDSLPELVLTNSHNGTSSFQLWLGLFRLVCGNGLIVATSTFERHCIRHIGYQDKQVVEASYSILENAPKAIERVNEFRKVELLPAEREAFAKSALTLKYDDASPIEPLQLLTPRRFDDAKPDLWTTFNTVQENLIKGGQRGRSQNMRRTRTRAVNSIDSNMRLNKALWQLAESMRELKQF